MTATPVGATGRIMRGIGVRAEGIRWAKAASIWSRIAEVDGTTMFALYSPKCMAAAIAIASLPVHIAAKYLILRKIYFSLRESAEPYQCELLRGHHSGERYQR